MKLSPQQEKLFNSIKALKIDFSQAFSTDKKKAELIGNAIKDKCDQFLRLYKDQEAEKDRLLSVNELNKIKQNEYEIIHFITESKAMVDNFLSNPPKENILQNYLRGVKNENN